MIDQMTISLISALTALIASIVAPLVTLYVARSQIRVSVRSTNRQRWIDEFRDLVARLCSEIAIAVQARDKIVRDGKFAVTAEAEVLQDFGALIYTANKIRLMVNPLDHEHHELLETMDRMFDRFRSAPLGHDLQTEGREIVDQLVSRSLSIIRTEWIRVQRGD